MGALKLADLSSMVFLVALYIIHKIRFFRLGESRIPATKKIAIATACGHRTQIRNSAMLIHVSKLSERVGVKRFLIIHESKESKTHGFTPL